MKKNLFYETKIKLVMKLKSLNRHDAIVEIARMDAERGILKTPADDGNSLPDIARAHYSPDLFEEDPLR